MHFAPSPDVPEPQVQSLYSHERKVLQGEWQVRSRRCYTECLPSWRCKPRQAGISMLCAVAESTDRTKESKALPEMITHHKHAGLGMKEGILSVQCLLQFGQDCLAQFIHVQSFQRWKWPWHILEGMQSGLGRREKFKKYREMSFAFHLSRIPLEHS